MTCVYHVYEHGELVATGRLTLETLPAVGETLTLNGRRHVVREVLSSGGEPVLTLDAS
jgi:hypothetical protein